MYTYIICNPYDVWSHSFPQELSLFVLLEYLYLTVWILGLLGIFSVAHVKPEIMACIRLQFGHGQNHWVIFIGMKVRTVRIFCRHHLLYFFHGPLEVVMKEWKQYVLNCPNYWQSMEFILFLMYHVNHCLEVIYMFVVQLNMSTWTWHVSHTFPLKMRHVVMVIFIVCAFSTLLLCLHVIDK